MTLSLTATTKLLERKDRNRNEGGKAILARKDIQIESEIIASNGNILEFHSLDKNIKQDINNLRSSLLRISVSFKDSISCYSSTDLSNFQQHIIIYQGWILRFY